MNKYLFAFYSQFNFVLDFKHFILMLFQIFYKIQFLGKKITKKLMLKIARLKRFLFIFWPVSLLKNKLVFK